MIPVATFAGPEPSHIFPERQSPVDILWLPCPGFLGFLPAHFCCSIQPRRPSPGSIDLGYLAPEYSLSRVKPSPRSTSGLCDIITPFWGLMYIWEISGNNMQVSWEYSGWGLQGSRPLDTPQKWRWASLHCLYPGGTFAGYSPHRGYGKRLDVPDDKDIQRLPWAAILVFIWVWLC